jgi:hypothetical protein
LANMPLIVLWELDFMYDGTPTNLSFVAHRCLNIHIYIFCIYVSFFNTVDFIFIILWMYTYVGILYVLK